MRWQDSLGVIAIALFLLGSASAGAFFVEWSRSTAKEKACTCPDLKEVVTPPIQHDMTREEIVEVLRQVDCDVLHEMVIDDYVVLEQQAEDDHQEILRLTKLLEEYQNGNR